MALTDYHHGTRVIEVNAGTRPLRVVNTSVIGLVATAADADATFFPLDTPVLITDLDAAIGKAGTDGTLKTTLTNIAAQGRFATVVVRVAEGEDVAETNTNVIGTTTSNGQKTGLQALLGAKAALGVQPRILGCPGLDTQPVTAALATLAGKLRGFAYAAAIGNTVTAAATYRAQFGQRELMLIYPDWLGWDTTTSATIAMPATAHALGLRAKIDNETGWHKTLSNVAVSGVTGVSLPIHWDLQDMANDAGVLNTADVTTLVNANGYRYWGSRTCSDDPQFAFESSVRTCNVLKDTIAEGMLWAVDKPMHPSIIKDIINTINAKFRQLKTLGYILGGEAWYDPDINTADSLKTGQLVIDFDYTPVPPIEDLAFRQRITDRYYADFASAITAA